ncbi:alpha/beta fold hydrolase [Novosphingobium sp. M1R2S20]|uniref:Alpha/beta fold hydrolase n=1 Tax=Novosphingobium rhizovicinum TaxID=3228928 RepID=A0ABV3RF73_9SPHN
MPLSLLFCHGWGFDAKMWDALAGALPEFAHVRDDSGYFGPTQAPPVPSPYLAVTHSFGTMRLLDAPPPGLAGLIAIAGFDRFTATDGFPGSPRRVVDRMVSAVAQEPATVLADFHARLGSPVPTGKPNAERLQADLVTLRDADLRARAGAIGVPILSLQAEGDPLLSIGVRETVFAAAPGVMRRTHPDAGHLLPVAEPSWCAEAIRAFAGTLP